MPGNEKKHMMCAHNQKNAIFVAVKQTLTQYNDEEIIDSVWHACCHLDDVLHW